MWKLMIVTCMRGSSQVTPVTIVGSMNLFTFRIKTLRYLSSSTSVWKQKQRKPGLIVAPAAKSNGAFTLGEQTFQPIQVS